MNKLQALRKSHLHMTVIMPMSTAAVLTGGWEREMGWGGGEGNGAEGGESLVYFSPGCGSGEAHAGVVASFLCSLRPSFGGYSTGAFGAQRF
jgi:hypothetical protein